MRFEVSCVWFKSGVETELFVLSFCELQAQWCKNNFYKKIRDQYDLKLIYYLKKVIFPFNNESKQRISQHFLFVIVPVNIVLSKLGLFPIILTRFL